MPENTKKKFTVRDINTSEIINDPHTYHEPHLIRFKDQPFDIACHPFENKLASALINGTVTIHSYNNDTTTIKLNSIYNLKSQSCRSLDFSHDGNHLYTGSRDASIHIISLESNKIISKISSSHDNPINKIKTLDSNLIATGDESGIIKIWDTRTQKPVRYYSQNHDFITDFAFIDCELYATSADGFLSIFDTRKNSPLSKSENQDDELLCLEIVKNSKKVVVGTQNGILEIFSRGNWGDCTDRIPGHPSSIDTMTKLSDNIICTGSSDGKIRLLSILPNKFVNEIADLDDFPIERLRTDRNGLLVSCSHDQTVRFFKVDPSLQNDKYDSDEDYKKQKNKKMKASFKKTINDSFFNEID